MLPDLAGLREFFSAAQRSSPKPSSTGMGKRDDDPKESRKKQKKEKATKRDRENADGEATPASSPSAITVSVALPGSIIDNAQSLEMATLVFADLFLFYSYECFLTAPLMFASLPVRLLVRSPFSGYTRSFFFSLPFWIQFPTSIVQCFLHFSCKS